jgi:hypothetical protein
MVANSTFSISCVVVIALERVEGNAYVFYRCKLTNEIESKGQYCLGE